MRLERLLSVTKEDAVQGTYAYDDMGREASSVEGAVTNFYAYRGTETLFQNIYNNYSIDFLYAGSLRVARLDTSSGTGYNTYEYFHVDPLGSTRMVTSSTKSVLFTDSYQPFGQDNGTPTGSSAEKFAGKSSIVSGRRIIYAVSDWDIPSSRAGVIAGI